MSEISEPLSEREIEILRLVATGAPNKEIARQLVISPNTVKVHLRNIFAKIGVTTRTEATLYAIQLGLINPSGQTAPEEEAVETATDAVPSPDPAPVPDLQPIEAPPVPHRRISPWQGLAVAAAAILLIVSGVLAARWFDPGLATAAPGANLLTITATPSQRWTAKSDLPAPRMAMGGVEYNNDFYLIGGATANGLDNSLLRYTPLTDRWQSLAAKPTPVGYVKAVLVGERIYVPGGRLADGNDTATLEVYDPREDRWSQLSPLPEPISGYALAAYEGRLFLFGGQSNGKVLDHVYEYSPDDDRWVARTPLPAPAAFCGATVIGNRIFVVGGFDGSLALSDNRAYYPSRDADGEKPWETFTAMPNGRYAMAITSLSNVIYIAGGLSDGNNDPAIPATIEFMSQSNLWALYDSPGIPLGAYGLLLESEGFLHFLGGEYNQTITSTHEAFQALYSLSIPIISNDQ